MKTGGGGWISTVGHHVATSYPKPLLKWAYSNIPHREETSILQPLLLPGCSVSFFSPKKSDVSCLLPISFYALFSSGYHEETHPPSSLIPFVHIVSSPSKCAASHLPVVSPPTVVFETNKHHPYTSPFPGIAILYHISLLSVSKMEIRRDIDFLYCWAGFTMWVMECTFISQYK